MPLLNFSRREFDRRIAAARASLERDGLDGLVLFRQDSMYYLTGYDTSGYSMFQGMYLGADGALALLTRSADRIQSRETSIVEDIRIWQDREDASPGDDLRDMLEDHGCRGRRLGVEYHAYGLTGQRAKMVDAALDGFCRTVDASDLVRLLRLVKSDEELAYVRKAGSLCDRILDVSIERTVPGASVKAVYGAMMQALMEGGGDPTAGRWPMGAGEAAVFCRYHTGDETVAERDQVVFEPAAAFRHYHAAMMYNILTGTPDHRHVSMNRACADAIDACLETLRPGKTVGDVFDAHSRTLGDAGFGHARLAACGYTMGAMYPPTWMDWPMVWAGNPQVLEPGMVFFLHMILLDDTTGLSMCIGETAIVTDSACERVNHIPREPIVN
ncbi:MAG: Xaa-Pro peptidase family protein [bacterium]|nr:Xaa-Pro peptidase family protein [bacterium]MDE0416674.1 Xaa-Pro peptidase family protein [bacterium]